MSKTVENKADIDIIKKPLPGLGGGSEFTPLPKQEGGAETGLKGKFKRSGHLTDQILKYNYPKDRQPSLFDNLQSETLKDIEVAGVEVAQIVEGI